MKLLRFIKNVWYAITDATIGRDVRGLTKEVGLWAGAMAVTWTIFMGLGVVGKWLGFMKWMKPDSQNGFDGLMGLGAIMFVILLLALVAVIWIFVVYTKLKKIWQNS